jgi:hypothetical protein
MPDANAGKHQCNWLVMWDEIHSSCALSKCQNRAERLVWLAKIIEQLISSAGIEQGHTLEINNLNFMVVRQSEPPRLQQPASAHGVHAQDLRVVVEFVQPEAFS